MLGGGTETGELGDATWSGLSSAETAELNLGPGSHGGGRGGGCLRIVLGAGTHPGMGGRPPSWPFPLPAQPPARRSPAPPMPALPPGPGRPLTLLCPPQGTDSESEDAPPQHSFVNHYMSDPTYYNSWKRRAGAAPHRYEAVAGAEAGPAPHAVVTTQSAVFAPAARGARTPLTGFSSFV